MAYVLSAKPVPSKKRIELTVSDGGERCAYTVSLSTYEMLGSPTAADEISSPDLDSIRFEDESYRALRRAMGYLSSSDKSRLEMRMKLIRAGYSPQIAESAVERLVELGYLDEDRQLDRAVQREANYNLRGRYYIKRKLSSKGYSSSAINRAIERLTESGDVDFSSNLDKLFEKKGVRSEEERTALEYKFGYRI